MIPSKISNKSKCSKKTRNSRPSVLGSHRKMKRGKVESYNEENPFQMFSEETSTYLKQHRETIKFKASHDVENTPSGRPRSMSIKNTLSVTAHRKSVVVSKDELISPKNEKVNWIKKNKRAVLRIKNQRVKNIEDIKNERLE